MINANCYCIVISANLKKTKKKSVRLLSSSPQYYLKTSLWDHGLIDFKAVGI